MSDVEYSIRPNKTQLKREMRALNDLGKELVGLPESSLQKFPLSTPVIDAIADARRFSKGALQRQLRRIASLLQQEDLDAINLELTRLKQPGRQQTAEFHELENWRDRLIAGDDALLTELIDRFTEIDRQYLRQLVRNAEQEKIKDKPPKSARTLFRYLAEIKTNQLSQ